MMYKRTLSIFKGGMIEMAVLWTGVWFTPALILRSGFILRSEQDSGMDYLANTLNPFTT